MTQLETGNLRDSISRAQGINLPRTGIDQSLNAPGVVPMPAVESPDSKLASQINSLFGAGIAATNQLGQTMQAEHVKQVEAEVSAAYEHFLAGRKNPTFNTKEAQDLFYKLEGGRDAAAFDLGTIQNNPGESDGAALARTIETTHGGMPASYRMKLLNDLAPRLAEERARATIRTQAQLREESVAGLAQTIARNPYDLSSVEEAWKVSESLGVSRADFVQSTIGESVKTLAMNGDLAGINQLEANTDIGRYAPVLLASARHQAMGVQAQAQEAENKKQADALFAISDPEQLRTKTNDLKTAGRLSEQQSAAWTERAKMLEQKQAADVLAGLQPMQRIGAIADFEKAGVYSAAEAAKYREDAVHDNRSKFISDTLTDVASSKLTVGDASAALNQRLLAGRNNPADPNGITFEQWNRASGELERMQGGINAAQINEAIVTSALANPNSSNAIGSEQDNAIIASQIKRGVMGGVMTKDGSGVFSSFNAPAAMAVEYAKLGRAPSRVQTIMAEKLSTGMKATDMQAAVQYTATLLKTRKAMAFDMYDKLSPRGQAVFNAIENQISTNAGEIGSPQWADLMQKLPSQLAGMQAPTQIDDKTAQQLMDGGDVKGMPAYKELKEFLDSKDFTDNWTPQVDFWMNEQMGGRKPEIPLSVINSYNDTKMQLLRSDAEAQTGSAEALSRLNQRAAWIAIGKAQPVEWNKNVKLTPDAPYALTSELSGEFKSAIEDRIKSDPTGLSLSHYVVNFVPVWDKTAVYTDPSTGKQEAGGWVLVNNTTQPPTRAFSEPWRPVKHEPQSIAQMRSKMEEDGRRRAKVREDYIRNAQLMGGYAIR